VAESNVIPTHTLRPAPGRDARLIGALLVESGRLRAQDVENVLRLQREKRVSFGEAALALGLVSRADIDHALSRQFELSYLVAGESTISQEVVAAYSPFSRQADRLRGLRNQLMGRWFGANPENKALAIISAQRGEGRSFIAANLSVAFSQLGARTALIDGDLRNPRQHLIFDLDGRTGLSTVLSGRAGTEAVQSIAALPQLWVMPAGVAPPNPADLLSRPLLPRLLQQLATQFDVILIDSPAAAESPDAQSIAACAGAALIVARRNTARAWRVQGICERVVQAKTSIVGAVLNSR
jgi:protein-tyrosine kinase